ncbi:alpha/beta hydrolase [Actinoplanes aureus]|uniref:Alpha/beta-hydrolase family protein n=1 Tax=Actinoplanes aureus TaxID=2792083 RepID=A0A931FZP0_9ACTN|nr:alpha/beta-hydrolase family protein [Actinoplanes aureus]MBG0565873.1 alpha/beta-hydrolase family protein [Actinoplanes aureus]
MRMWLHRRRYTYSGLAGATVMFCLSLTPSLLPRGYLFQGLISGLLAAIGYGIGTLGVWLARQLSGRTPAVPHRRAWQVLAGLAPVAIVVLFLGARWQAQIHRLIGMDPPPAFGYVLVLPIAVLTGAGWVGLVRLLRRAARWLAALLGRWVPAAAARALAVVAVVLLLLGLLDGVVLRAAFSAADASFRTLNGEIRPDQAAPADRLRSGGPGSLVSWESLGNQGRNFIGGGPDVTELERFGGPGAQPPVRVYVGMNAAASSRERAALAVRELRRTGAFDRAVLCLITTTGTGWVNELAADPLEYLYHGDTALVATQYSYLPSPISFLVDKERARDAGRDLFDAVYGVWSRLPAAGRPKLLVLGESLGSFGAEAAFSGVADIRNRTDGMLLIGPPNRNQLWGDLVGDREPGTRAVLPVYEQGETVRFAADPAGLNRAGYMWPVPRVVYLQYPSDPITWWSPRLMVSRPDWLAEPRGSDVLPAVRWYPFVTFWQVSADMAFANNVPAGHGHNFGTAPAAAWAQIAPPPGWTGERTAALVGLLAGER